MNLEAFRDFSVPLKPLLSFSGGIIDETQLGIPFHLADYLELVDQTGRIVKENKRSSISDSLSVIFDRLHIDPKSWMINSTLFEQIYQQRFGREQIT